MYRVEDSIGGRRLRLVHGAPQLPLPASAGRWTKAAAVRRFASSHGAKGVLRVRDPDGGETWRASPGAGASLAAALEDWLAEGRAEGPVSVAVPLDERVYIADILDGLVSAEHAAGVERAGELLAERERIVAFEGGARGDWLRARQGGLALEPLPFDLWSRRYAYASGPLALLRHGVPSAWLAAVPASLAAAALAWTMLSERRDAAASAAAEEAELDRLRLARQREEALLARHDAAATIGAAADAAFAERQIARLHRDGLESVAVSGGAAVYAGRRRDAYPAGVAALGEADAWEVSLAGDGGWEARRAVDAPADVRAVDAAHEDVARRLFAAARAARARVEPSGRVHAHGATESHYVLEIDGATRSGLRRLAEGLRGWPVAVDRVACDVDAWIVSRCRVDARAKGVGGA